MLLAGDCCISWTPTVCLGFFCNKTGSCICTLTFHLKGNICFYLVWSSWASLLLYSPADSEGKVTSFSCISQSSSGQQQDFVQIHLLDIEIFHEINERADLPVEGKLRRSPNSIRLHLLGTVNICTDFHAKPSDIC